MTLSEQFRAAGRRCPHCGSIDLIQRPVRIYMIGAGLTDLAVPHCQTCHTDLVIHPPEHDNDQDN